MRIIRIPESQPTMQTSITVGVDVGIRVFSYVIVQDVSFVSHILDY